MNKRKSKEQRKLDLSNQIIQRKNDEIESLKNQILDLQIDNDEKDELIDSIESLREEFKDIIAELDSCRDEYKSLISELLEMKKVMTENLFGSELRWKLVRWLIK